MRFVGFTASLLLSAAVAARGAGTLLVVGEPTVGVKVVATPDELIKTEMITPDDAAYRVGIEANTVALGSGVMVYTWWNGKGVTRTRAEVPLMDQLVGPLRVAVVPRKGAESDANINNIYLSVGRQESIYASYVAPTKIGTYDVKFYTLTGDLIAQTALEVVDKETQTFHALSINPKPGAKTAEGYAPARSAVPNVISGSVDSTAKELPRISALAEDKGITLSAKDGEVKIESKTMFMPAIKTHMLARFFVNGKPVALKPKVVEDVRNGFVGGGRSATTQTIKFSLDPADYSAKEGDTVEVQILLTPAGFREIGSQGYYYRTSGNGRVLLPRLSPKVTLIGPAESATTTKAAPDAK